jgi:hypothetical protein
MELPIQARPELTGLENGTHGHTDDGIPFEVIGGHARLLNVRAPEGRDADLLTSLPRASDVVPLIDESRMNEYESPLKDFYDRYTLDQDGVGSCAWEATANCLTAAIWRQKPGLLVLFNPWTGYARTNSRDYGSDSAENFDVATKFGLIPDALWPRYDSAGKQAHSWRSLPANADQLAAPFRFDAICRVRNLREFKSCVKGGHPVNFGVRWGVGGHAITGIDFDDNYLYAKGSWGSGYDEGFGRKSYHRFTWSRIQQGLDTFSAVAAISVVLSEMPDLSKIGMAA